MAKSEVDPSGLDLVRLLLRRVVRGFYSAKHSIVLDIVIKHSAIRDDYLSQMMGLQNQEVRKLCGRLREDRILTMHTRQEPKEGQTRPINRTYYYIDYRDAVDSVKYRVHRLVRTIEDQSKNDFDSKGYVCPYCQRRYGPLDVLPLVAPDGQSFRCSDCYNILADDEESMESKVSQERLAKLQKQTNRLVSTLKMIDSSVVPDNDFATALAKAITPILAHLHPHGMPATSKLSYENNNVNRTTTSALGVQVDYNVRSNDTPAEQARKAAEAQMNALPEWHVRSTVSGETIQAHNPVTMAVSDDTITEVKLDAAASDEVAEYYKAMKAQEAAESSSSDNDEDEEEDFEDVDTSATQQSNTVGESHEISTAVAGDQAPKDAESDDDEFEDV